ncbi:hypothetical protein ACSSS7_003107 [Eimeria intestinalis]
MVESPQAKTPKSERWSATAGERQIRRVQPFWGLPPSSLAASVFSQDPGQTLEDLVSIIESGIESPQPSDWLAGDFEPGLFLIASEEGLAASKSWQVSSERASSGSPGGEDVGVQGGGPHEPPEIAQLPSAALAQLQPSEALVAEATSPDSSTAPFEMTDPLEFFVIQAERSPAPEKAGPPREQVIPSPSTSFFTSAESSRRPESPSSDEDTLEEFASHTFMEAHIAGVEGDAPLSAFSTGPSAVDTPAALVHQPSSAQTAQHPAMPVAFPRPLEHMRQELPGAHSPLSSSATRPFPAPLPYHVSGAPQLFPGPERRSYVFLETPLPVTPAAARLSSLLGLRRSLGLEPPGPHQVVRPAAAFPPQLPTAPPESFMSYPALQWTPGLQHWQGGVPFHPAAPPAPQTPTRGVPVHRAAPPAPQTPTGGVPLHRAAPPAPPTPTPPSGSPIAAAPTSPPSTSSRKSPVAWPAGGDVMEKMRRARVASPAQSESVYIRDHQVRCCLQPGVNAAAPTRARHLPAEEAAVESYFQQHLYYRIPSAPEIRVPFTFSLTAVFFGKRPPLAALLSPIRQELVKRRLTLAEAHVLFQHVNRLIYYANSYHTRPLRGTRSYELVAPLGARILIADTLYCACQVLGASMRKETWWSHVVGSMLAPPVSWLPDSNRGQREKLLIRLFAAAEVYKRGERPLARVVVGIKRALFLEAKAPLYFKAPEWDVWRGDDNVDPDGEQGS